MTKKLLTFKSCFVICLLVIIIDQLTKWACVNYIEYGSEGIEIFPFFNIVHVYNYGAAFSFLASMGGWQRYFFALISIVLSLVFLVLLLKTKKEDTWLRLSYTLFIAGALGNLIDRVFLGYVVDFLLFYIKTDTFFWSYPVFNVADISVCCGAFILVIVTLFSKSEKNK